MLKRFYILTVFFLASSYCAAFENVNLKYSPSQVVVDYSKSTWAKDIKKVKIYHCVETLDECQYSKDAVAENNSFTINSPGLYRIDFHDDWESYGKFLSTLWKQFVYISPLADTEVNLAAIKYAPYLSFDESERFSPVYLGDIYRRPLTDFDLVSIPDDSRKQDYSVFADVFMESNGHKDARLFLKQSVAKEIKKREDFPTYWMHEVVGGKLLINYFWLFPYDYKANKGIADLDGSYNHAVDREGVTVVFERTGDSWTPSNVIYAGHLESQEIEFLGCDNIAEKCAGPSSNDALHTSFGKNKAILSWANVSKYNERPIVYFAHGSHAAMPAFGWYKVITAGFIDGLIERAGSSDVSKLLLGTAVKLNFNSLQSSEIALSFSGYLIDVNWSKSNVRSYPFIRNPISTWISSANNAFDNCISNKNGCEKYINRPSDSGLLPSYAINFDQPTLTALGASGSNYTLITGKDGRPAVQFAGVSSPGYLQFPNNPSMAFSTGGTFDFWARVDSNTGMNGYGSVSTQGWAMALLAKSHDRTGVVINTVAADPSYPGDGYGFSGFSTFDTTWGSSNPPCVIHQINPGNQLGTWFRVTAVASNTSGTQIYINKQLVSECAGARPEFATMNSQDLYIGRYSSSWYPLHGAIQDIRIYNKALTASEVNALQ